MSLPITVRPEATQDAEDARAYLESELPGLGEDFLSRLDEVFDRIRYMPKMYGIVARNVRAARLRRFTYVVYYRLHKDRVEVLAILHGHRDPAVWQSRT